MIGFPVAIVFSNAFEWYAHKHWLHEYARQHRFSPFFSHMRHHKAARLNGFHDERYERTFMTDQDVYIEKTQLLMLCAATTVVAPVAPFFTLGTYYGAWNYYRKHQRAHNDPEWGRKNLPWHYDHHMNANQDANWCVTRPWFDYIMGTRIKPHPEAGESNPLGMRLPRMLDGPVNWLSERWLTPECEGPPNSTP